MSDQTRDSLDDAIDRVAAVLVSVEDDPNVVRRIVSSLPPRHRGGWWALSSLPLQAVALTVAVLMVVYVRWSTEHPPSLAGNRVASFGEAGSAARNQVASAGEAGSSARDQVASAGEAGSAAPAGGQVAGVAETGSAAPARGPVTGVAGARADRRRAASDPVTRPFELSAIAAPEQLTLSALQTTTPLATVEPASIAPIVLSDLPLAENAESPLLKE